MGQEEEQETGAPAVAIHRGPGPFPHEVHVREHVVLADEPPVHGGHDTGPDPFELLAAALAACTSMTLRAYAARKGWDLTGLAVGAAWDGEDADGRTAFRVDLDLPSGLDEDQVARLQAVARKCPTRKALAAGASFTERVGALETDHNAAAGGR